LFVSGLSVSFVLGSLISQVMVIDSWYVVDNCENSSLSLSLLLTSQSLLSISRCGSAGKDVFKEVGLYLSAIRDFGPQDCNLVDGLVSLSLFCSQDIDVVVQILDAAVDG
jgi:hypothetical protein